MVVFPCPITRDVRRPGTLIVKKIGIICCLKRIRCVEPEERESGAWLSALPFSSLWTLLDSESFTVAIDLRVGTDVCIPHTCRCGGRRDSRGLHGLSCKYSAGLFPRHSAIDDVIKRTLQKAGLASVLKPLGLDRGDGSRPDGITVFPFSGGKSFVCYCTCMNTFAEVRLNRTAMEAGTAINCALNTQLLQRHISLSQL